ncbi:hypothetical protein MCFN_01895 [Mycoplasmopsis californica]|uniref:Uncharacterized protein n=1 Tax=Mycoplasmopsis californica TaxID=2113 RepID=A0A059XR41_9BACT|nr:hypothetical protein [Mycoplasmopsis californica]AIA29520.1 hypothetical protein MCFN_01895 [Mycoplasmopsis californica]
MATIERDPLIAADRIQKRRELLIQLHAENQEILQNPALIKNDKMAEKDCQNIDCLLKQKLISEKEYKRSLVIKVLSIIFSALLIITATLLAILFSRVFG